MHVQPRKDIIVLHKKDHVATALVDLQAGLQVHLEGRSESVTIKQEIRFGHKFALQHIEKGEVICKYGVPIGRAYKNIEPGEHIHMHNLMSLQKEGVYHEGLQESGWKNRDT